MPNSGMAVTIDIGEANDLHPRNKLDVGRRLALWALAGTYKKEIVYSGPFYRSMAIEGAKIRLAFDHVGGGLVVGEKQGLEPTREIPGGKLTGFAIAGRDKVWHWAEAQIEGKTVVVSSGQVRDPVAVRYAYQASPACNLYNKAGLPAAPFRTDDWSSP